MKKRRKPTGRYLARVVAIFQANKDATSFESWEHLIMLEADGPRDALKRAISLSRSVLDDPETVRVMGYGRPPCLYGVKSVESQPPEPLKEPEGEHIFAVLTADATLNDKDMQMIESHKSVTVPYKVIYIDRP